MINPQGARPNHLSMSHPIAPPTKTPAINSDPNRHAMARPDALAPFPCCAFWSRLFLLRHLRQLCIQFLKAAVQLLGPVLLIIGLAYFFFFVPFITVHGDNSRSCLIDIAAPGFARQDDDRARYEVGKTELSKTGAP